MSSRAPQTVGRIAGAAVVAALLAGCAQTRKFQPAVDPAGLSDIQFVHYLEGVPLATFGEACRAALIVADGETRFGDHAGRYAELRSRGVVRDAWKLEAGHVLDVGTLAYMAAEVCALPPTVNTVLFGSWGLGDRRYAVRQAASRGILEYAPTHEPVTGGELLQAIGRMDDYLARQGRGGVEQRDIDAPGDVATAGPARTEGGER